MATNTGRVLTTGRSFSMETRPPLSKAALQSAPNLLKIDHEFPFFITFSFWSKILSMSCLIFYDNHKSEKVV